MWDIFEGQNLLRPRAAIGEEPWAAALAGSADGSVAPFSPQEAHILVVGGKTLASYRLFGATPVLTVAIGPWR